MLKYQPHLLLTNGPSTCVPLCIAVKVLRMLGLAYTKSIYVESIARVNNFSLSAKIVKPMVDVLCSMWGLDGAKNISNIEENEGEQQVFMCVWACACVRVCARAHHICGIYIILVSKFLFSIYFPTLFFCNIFHPFLFVENIFY